MSESLAFQRCEILFDVHRRVLQAVALLLGGRADHIRSKIKLAVKELIGMLRLDAIRFEGFLREVLQIKCHDGVGPATDGGSQDMPVIWIGEHESTDKRFVARDKAVTNMQVHQVSDTLDLFAWNVGMVFDDVCIHSS